MSIASDLYFVCDLLDIYLDAERERAVFHLRNRYGFTWIMSIHTLFGLDLYLATVLSRFSDLNSQTKWFEGGVT